MRMKRLLMTLLLLLLITTIPPISYGVGVLFVPDDFPSIQEAINASDKGGLIIVKKGIYSEILTITKSLALRAEGRVILTNYQDCPTILIENAQKVRIEGIELEYNLVGIEIRDSSQVSLLDMDIEPAVPDHSYVAILVGDSQVRISGSMIAGGTKGIALSGLSQADIIGNSVAKGIIAGIFVGDQS